MRYSIFLRCARRQTSHNVFVLVFVSACWYDTLSYSLIDSFRAAFVHLSRITLYTHISGISFLWLDSTRFDSTRFVNLSIRPACRSTRTLFVLTSLVLSRLVSSRLFRLTSWCDDVASLSLNVTAPVIYILYIYLYKVYWYRYRYSIPSYSGRTHRVCFNLRTRHPVVQSALSRWLMLVSPRLLSSRLYSFSFSSSAR